MESSVSKGALGAYSSEFFSTENGKTVPRPKQASDIPDALKPTLYLKMSKLPFANLLSVSPKQNPK
jgi:hypothetical protein